MNNPVPQRPEIRKVERDSDEMQLLKDFVTHFSWQEVREHTLHMVRHWMYQDWETPFLALLDGKPVGMVCFGFILCGREFSAAMQFGDLGRNAVRDAAVEYVYDTLLTEL